MKTVQLLIEVPEGDFCYGGDKSCQFYNNDHGVDSCTLGFNRCDDEVGGYKKGGLLEWKNGKALKPDSCKNLKEVEDNG